jgi:hypothetical protein
MVELCFYTFTFMYSSSIEKRLLAKSEVSNYKFYNEKAAFIVRKRGTFALRGNDPFGSWYLSK